MASDKAPARLRNVSNSLPVSLPSALSLTISAFNAASSFLTDIAGAFAFLSAAPNSSTLTPASSNAS